VCWDGQALGSMTGIALGQNRFGSSDLQLGRLSNPVPLAGMILRVS